MKDLGACKYDCDCSQCDAAICFKVIIIMFIILINLISISIIIIFMILIIPIMFLMNTSTIFLLIITNIMDFCLIRGTASAKQNTTNAQ